MTTINKVAVLGSGTMGLGIAALCANAGHEVVLLDLSKQSCDDALPKLLAGRSPVVSDAAVLDKITTGSFENDSALLSDCQWICEAVVENVDIKRAVFENVEKHRADNSIISTNTSGIPLHEIDNGMPMRLQQDIAVTHFFNPVHLMRLVELVPGKNTKPEVISRLADFHGNELGKGVVYAKDTVNFIGNRIGCMWVNAGLHMAENAIINQGMSIEEVDAVLGQPIGLPETGLYALTDLIGLDVMVNVNKNLAHNLPENDFCRQFIELTPCVSTMVENGQLGRKTGGGFYQLIRHEDGSKHMEIFDIASNQWKPQQQIELSESESDFKSLFNADGIRGQLVRDLMFSTLYYAADLVPEIADDIVNIDRAMRWGFAWQKGPFELIDEIGIESVIAVAKEKKLKVPGMIGILAEHGESQFYRNQGTEFFGTDGNWRSVPPE